MFRGQTRKRRLPCLVSLVRSPLVVGTGPEVGEARGLVSIVLGGGGDLVRCDTCDGFKQEARVTLTLWHAIPKICFTFTFGFSPP